MLFALVIGLLAHALGFHPAVGAYMAGLILREEYFSKDGEETQMAYSGIKSVLDNVAFVWIGPVFLVLLGAQMKFDADLFIDVIPETLALTGALIFAQVTSAALAARYTGNMDFAYVQNQILTDQAFYTLMFTAFWLNMLVPLTIRWWKPYYMARKGV